MAFPTTAVLDDFNRADSTTTIGTSWSVLADYFSGDADHGIISNQLYNPQTDDYVAMYWNAGTFGPDSECYMTVTTVPSVDESLSVGVRNKDVGVGTYDGYWVFINTSTGLISVVRVDDDVATTLGSTVAITLSAGEKFGIEAIGSTLKAYHFTGGSWTEKASRTDSTYGAAGLLAFYIPGAVVTGRFDDFGGGTVVAGGGATHPGYMQSRGGWW